MTAPSVAEAADWLATALALADRWPNLTLVVDDSRSMLIFQRDVDGLVAALARAEFTDLRVCYVRADRPGAIELTTQRQGRGERVPPEALAAEGEGRLVLAVTDAVGVAWRDDRLGRILRGTGTGTGTGRDAIVAVASVLPARMWPGTGIGVIQSDESRPVVVFECTPGDSERLAESPSRPNPLRPTPLPEPIADLPEPATVAARLRRFHAQATSDGRRLARCLAAAAPLTVPVMQMVHDAMLPDAGTSPLAEVVFGGLLEDLGTGDLVYEFRPGVREALLDETPRFEAIEVLQMVSEHVRPPLPFAAVLADPEHADVEAYRSSPALAAVTAAVLHRLNPRYRPLAERLTRPAEVEQKSSPISRSRVEPVRADPVPRAAPTARLHGRGSLLRRVFLTVALGAVTFLITNVLNQPTAISIMLSILIASVALVVQLLTDLQVRLSAVEAAGGHALAAMKRLVGDAFTEISEATALYGLIEASALQTDLVTQLVRNSTQFSPTSPPIVYQFAQHKINEMSDFLKQLGERGTVTYDGEDRDWLLGLTRNATASIDTISLAAADHNLWESEIGQRYLDAQRRAAAEGRRVRRIFVLDAEPDPALRRTIEEQRRMRIEVRVLDRRALPRPLQVQVRDLILFDDTLAYETTLTTSNPQWAQVAQTRLVLTDSRVKEYSHLFRQLWELAWEVSMAPEAL